MHELYSLADSDFTGRATVPVLWDKKRKTIVSNESAEIVRMFNSGFGALADESVDLYPQALRIDIDALNERIYPVLNNGVYRAGFATTQIAYDEAYRGVFAMLDELETRLADKPFLLGAQLTEADIRLFVTLVPGRGSPAHLAGALLALYGASPRDQPADGQGFSQATLCAMRDFLAGGAFRIADANIGQ